MPFNNQSIRVLAHDYETTGVDVAKLGVVQSALCFADLHQDGSYTILEHDVQVLNPCEDISAEASKIHGFTNFDVADKPLWEVYLKEQMATVNAEGIQAVVGYNNATFDDRIAARVGFQLVRSIDLMKAARIFKKAHGWESAKLTNTHLQLTGRTLEGAHDAFADIVGTLDIIQPAMKLAGVATLDEFVLWMRPADSGTPEMKITFGKHKGSKLKNLEKDYIRWCLENLNLDPDLRTGMEACQ